MPVTKVIIPTQAKQRRPHQPWLDESGWLSWKGQVPKIEELKTVYSVSVEANTISIWEREEEEKMPGNEVLVQG